MIFGILELGHQRWQWSRLVVQYGARTVAALIDTVDPSLQFDAAAGPAQALLHGLFADRKIPTLRFAFIGPDQVRRHDFLPACGIAERNRLLLNRGTEDLIRNCRQQVGPLR